MSENKENTIFSSLNSDIPAQIELDPTDQLKLKNDVQSLLRDDIKTLSMVRKLSKTDDTFSNSLGEIYFHIMDKKTCESEVCQGKTYLCPKKAKGYCSRLEYDSSRDEIRSCHALCPYMEAKMKSFKYIVLADSLRENMYLCANEMMDDLRKLGTKKLDKDSALYFMLAMKQVKAFKSDKDKAFIGCSFRSINSSNLAKKMLKAICYLYAKSEIYSAYVKIADLITAFFDRDYRTKELAEDDFGYILNVPALFIEDFDGYPRESATFNSDHLYQLLKMRALKGKITYCSMSKSTDPSKIVSSALRDCDCQSDGIDLVEKILKPAIIKDLDLN